MSHFLLTFGKLWLKEKPCDGLTKIHTGLDYSEPVGTPVMAAAPGYVRIVSNSGSEFKWWIVIDHGCFTTVYWHVNPIVTVGQWVNAGDEIATVADLLCHGSPCSHLHFGIRDATYASSPDIASRGSLPQTRCVVYPGRPPDPPFKEYFQDPLTVGYHYGGGCPPNSCCINGAVRPMADCNPGLSVTLTASPTTGSAPLSGVTLTAAVTGSAQQTINYTFYCDHPDTGVNITGDWIAKVNATYANPLTAPATCTYPVAGTYLAKVIVEQGTGAKQAQAEITVGQVTPNCYPLDLAANTPAGGGIPTAAPTQSVGCGWHQYVPGEGVQVTAYPANGWGIGGWLGTQNDASTSSTNSVIMPGASHAVTVNYIQSSQNGGPSVSTGSADNITATSAVLHGMANPNGVGTTAFFEFGTDVDHSVTSTDSQFMGNGTSWSSFAELATGLACGTTYTYYAVASSSAGTNLGQRQRFTTSPCNTSSAPIITAESVDGIGQTTAVLHAWVNANGLPTTANFQYGTNPATAVTSTPLQSLASSTNPAQIDAAIGGLTCGTTYTYYAIGTNSAGTVEGLWQNFTTAACTPRPSITSEWVDSITAGSARLWAWVDGHNASTNAYFQYSQNPAVSITGTQPQPFTGLAEINWIIGGLSCATTYSYDATATNEAGTTLGPWQTFTTDVCGPMALPGVRDESVDQIGGNYATFHAFVNPNGAGTGVYFRYYIGTSPISTTRTQYLNGDTGWVPVEEVLFSGALDCNGTYYYQAVVFNTTTGQTFYLPFQSFDTKPCTDDPFITTFGADGITQYSANLHGMIDPNGSYTDVYFEYGLDTNYGYTSSDQVVAPGTAVPYTIAISEPLQCGALYHYRAAATDVWTTVYGADRTFTTAPCDPAAGSFFHTVPPCRLLDTRTPGDQNGPALRSGDLRSVPFVGSCGVRARATAVAVNVTIVNPAADGYLTLAATIGIPPQTSTINFRQGQVRANNQVVGLNPDGTLSVYCSLSSAGAVDYIIDVTGYYQQ